VIAEVLLTILRGYKSMITIDWMKGWANDPRIFLDIEIPIELSKHIFEEHRGLFFSVDKKSSQVKFFSYHKLSSGYGGAQFNLRMKDGTIKTLVGPWSSRCSVMNANGFPHSVEVVYQNNTSGAMLVSKVRKLLVAANIPAILEYDEAEYKYTIKGV